MSNITAIVGGTVITPFQEVKNGIVFIECKNIIAVNRSTFLPENVKVINAKDKYVVPGFIDLHIHGGGGYDTMDSSHEAIQKIAATHARFGTTGMLLTTVTESSERLIQSIEVVKEAMQKGTGSSQIFGVHLEGPFINPEQKGAHREEYIRKPSINELVKYIQVGNNIIRLVTLAPEIPGALELIYWLQKQGILCSAGHSNANFEQTQTALKSGLAHITHIFNAMRGFHHREPGIIGAALASPYLSLEMIADCVHLHPAVMKMIIKAKENKKVILVTDAMRGAGVREGAYELGGQKVIVKNGQARLKDGTLAGSILTMDKAVKNIVKNVGVTLMEAIRMASSNPADLLGLNRHKGSIEPGKDADIVILNKKLETEITIVAGKVVYSKNK